MANDKLKHEEEPPGSTLPLQHIKETDIPVKSNEAATSRSIVNRMNAAGSDDITMPWTTAPLSLFPSEDMNALPSPYDKEVPLTGINLMTDDLNPFSDSEYPVFDHLFGVSNTPIPPSLPGLKTEFRQTPDYSVRPDTVMSSMLDVNLLQDPYADRNLVTAKGSSAAASESIHPGEVIHSNTDKPQPFRDFKSGRVNQPVLFQNNGDADNATNNNFIITGVQKDCPEVVDASFLTLGIGQKTEDIDTLNIPGRNLTNNFENVVLPRLSSFYGRKEDRNYSNPSPGLAAGLPCLENNGGGLDIMKNNILKENGNPSFEVEGNQHTTSAYNSFQGYQPVFMEPVGSSLSGLPDSAQSRATGLPFCSSTATCLPVSGATDDSFFSDSSMVSPLIGVPRSSSLHDQSGNPFTANEDIAAQVSERGRVPSEFTFSQLPRKYYQPRLLSVDQSSTNLSRSLMTGEVRTSELNTTPEGCSTFIGTSLKRVAAEPPPAASRAQPKRRTQFSVSPSAPILSPNVSSLSSLSVASSFTSVASIAPSLQHRTEGLTSIPPLFQPCLSLPSQVIGVASLPPLSQNAPSLPPQANITALLRPLSWTTLCLPNLPGHTALLPPLPQVAPSLLSQAKSTIELPPQPRTAPSLRPTAKTTTSLPVITQNPPPLLPLTQSAPLPSRPLAALPLPQKSQIASPLLQKSQTASPLPPKPQTASSLHRKPQSASSLPSATRITLPVIPKQYAAPALYVKWNGFSETQPMGHKCLICKRDLSFTPEGPVSVPTIYPMVAVLPCGHTFHDHCLRLITPEDQAENPPCIPCAVGES